MASILFLSLLSATPTQSLLQDTATRIIEAKDGKETTRLEMELAKIVCPLLDP